MADVQQAQFLSDLTDGLRRCRSASMAVAFVTESGLKLDDVAPAIQQALDSDAQLRILLDLSLGNTDPSAVWKLVALAGQHPTVQVRAALLNDGRLLHSKFYLFDYGQELTLVTGSANLSRPALTANIEHGLTVRAPRTDPLIAEAIRFFDELWKSPAARPIDDEAARLYEEFCGRRRVLEGRAQRRSRASWRRLEAYLTAAPPPVLEWPSVEAAYIAGLIAARGTFNERARTIQIRLGFNKGSYPNGEIRVWNKVAIAEQVIPQIPERIAERLKLILPDGTVSSAGRVVTINLRQHRPVYDVIRVPFQPASDTTQFRLPRGLANAGEDVITEFVRGFAVASGLVTDHTALPAHPLTGVAMRVVWLRPKTGNKRLFDDVHALIEERLGIKVYTHWREYREPHLKIRCQDFLEIGFGIDWWDGLVAEGADYNELML